MCYSESYFAIGALVSPIIMAMVLVIVIFRQQNKTASLTRSDRKAPLPFIKLRDNVKQITGVLAEAGKNLEKLHLDVEDYGAKSWNQEKESEEKYLRLADSLFRLLDELEDLIKNENKSDDIDRIYRMTLRILEHEGIEEIPVKKGDHFSGTHHKCVGSRPDENPRSAILEIKRKGYYAKSKTGEYTILRPAEVIVSGGVSVEGPNQ